MSIAITHSSLAEHRHYLADHHRMIAYAHAIDETVRPGDVVLDLGAGSGILGLLACRAGASRVYSIDEGPVIELARRLCDANGFQNRVVFVKGHSLDIELPEQVDVVVADQIGFGDEFGLFRFFHDARTRLLKPGGSLIPARVDLCVAPVESEGVWSQIAFWDSAPAGFDLRPARDLAINTRYRAKLQRDELLAQPSVVSSFDLSSTNDAPLGATTMLVATRPGILHGLGGWFNAQLSANVHMTNIPFATDAIEREAVFFPVDHPIEIDEGDQIEVRLHVRWNDDMYTWHVNVWPPGGRAERFRKASLTHSTWKGMLLTAEDLRHTRPDFAPSLTPRGAARSLALSLCDGTRTIEEIEREVLRRYSALFRTQSDAAAFVSDLVLRYTM